jgi:hypothetical protein
MHYGTGAAQGRAIFFIFKIEFQCVPIATSALGQKQTYRVVIRDVCFTTESLGAARAHLPPRYC